MSRPDPTDLAALVRKAEEVGEQMRQVGAEYLYDGVYVWNDGFQIWVGTEQGDRVALCDRTLEMLLAYIEARK